MGEKYIGRGDSTYYRTPKKTITNTSQNTQTAAPMAGQGGTWDGTYAQPTGLQGMGNSFNKFTGAGDYINDAGYSTGGLGTAGSYTYKNPTTGMTESVGLSPEAMQSVQGTDVGGGLQAGDMGNYAQGLQALSGLANAYMGYKNYGLAKDMFGFEKAATNRNMANQASEYNTGIQNAGEVGMGLAGNTMDANARAARQAQLNSQKISTAPIG
jgi:hypothetical protein